MAIKLQSVQTEKKCTLCGEIKAAVEFYPHSQKPHLLHSWCKKCTNKKAVEHRKNNPLTVAARKQQALQTYYGISWEEYKALMENQGGRCAICGIEFDLTPGKGKIGNNKPCIDHCHTTGTIRGILCGHCNKGLGFFTDSRTKLYNALRYLEANNGN